MITTKQLKNQTKITSIYDAKYNETRASVRILFPLKKETAVLGNILAQLMNDRLVTHPTKAAMAKRLDDLFGAKVTAKTYAIGQYQVLEIVSIAIADTFVDTSLTQQQLYLMADVLFDVLINPLTLKEAIENIRQTQDRIKEKKNTYATIKAFELAGAHQTFSVNTYGFHDDLEHISVDDMMAFHRMILTQSHRLIYVVGALPELDYSRFEKGQSIALLEVLNPTKVLKETVEDTEVGVQSELIQVYETDIMPSHEKYAAYLVFVTVLGQLPSSLLFQNIREKHSLAYSIYAGRHIYDGVFYISTSIQATAFEQVVSLIDEQFEIIKNEAVDIEGAKTYLLTSLETVNESQAQQIDTAFRNDILPGVPTTEDLKAKVASLTLQDVKDVLNHVKGPFTYFRRGETHE